MTAAIGACGRELGPRAGAYGNAAVADDLDAVRATLGVERLDLYGNSYGTYLMTAYAARHPAHVRSIVLDAGYPIAYDAYRVDRLARPAGPSAWLRAAGLGAKESTSAPGYRPSLRPKTR